MSDQDTARVLVPRSREAYRDALQEIAQVLGPTAPPCCPGCQWEIARALEILRSVGVEYHARKATP